MRSVARRLGWLALSVAVGACARQRPASQVDVRVVDERGRPVAGARLLLDGQPVGRASAEGSLRVTWPGARRGRVELSVECGAGLRSPDPRRLRARHSGVRRLELVCAAKSHCAWLAILAPGAEGLPVRVDGEQVAEIDGDGVAHVQLVRPTGSEMQVRIDTSRAPHLRPQHPVVRATLDRDRLVVVQPQFERVIERKRGRRRPTPASPPRRLRSL